jgi:hypothetical protein
MTDVNDTNDANERENVNKTHEPNAFLATCAGCDTAFGESPAHIRGDDSTKAWCSACFDGLKGAPPLKEVVLMVGATVLLRQTPDGNILYLPVRTPREEALEKMLRQCLIRLGKQLDSDASSKDLLLQTLVRDAYALLHDRTLPQTVVIPHAPGRNSP